MGTLQLHSTKGPVHCFTHALLQSLNDFEHLQAFRTVQAAIVEQLGGRVTGEVSRPLLLFELEPRVPNFRPSDGG